MKSRSDKVLIIIALIMFFIIPTSINGNIYTVNQSIITWLILSMSVVFFLVLNKIELKNTIIVLFMLLYMIFATMIAKSDNNYDISIARIAPVLCSVILFSGVIDRSISFNFFKKLLHIMCTVLIIWNIATLLNIEVFIDFVINSYTQFYDYATEGQLIRGKPIFTFGVHNVAAFFYIQIFLMCSYTYKFSKNNFFLLYMIFILFFTIMLRSSTSFGYSGIMLFIFFNMTKKDYRIRGIIVIATIIGFVYFLTTPLFDTYKDIIFSTTNGFIPRYFGENTIFSTNFDILDKNPLGIGFTIPRGNTEAYFADSGILVYLTMGNLTFVFVMYLLFSKFVQKNFDKEYRIIIFITVILFELSMPSFIYLKSIFLFIFMAYFYKSLDEEKAKYNLKKSN